MKIRFVSFWGLAAFFFLAGTSLQPAIAQNSSDDQQLTPSPDMSPEDAYKYLEQLLKQLRNMPPPAPSYMPGYYSVPGIPTRNPMIRPGMKFDPFASAPTRLAPQAAALGVTNLLSVYQASGEKVYPTPEQKSSGAMPRLRNALLQKVALEGLRLAVKEEDVPQVLAAAEKDPELATILDKHTDDDKVVEFLKAHLELFGHEELSEQEGTTGIMQTINGADDRPAPVSEIASSIYFAPTYWQTMFKMAADSSNPALNEEANVILAESSKDNSKCNIAQFRYLMDYCLSCKDDKYDEGLADLIAGLPGRVEKKDGGVFGCSAVNGVEMLEGNFDRKLNLSGRSEVRDAVMRVTDLVKQERNIHGVTDNIANEYFMLRAYVGDQESFEKIVRDCADVAAKNASKEQEANVFYTKVVLDHVIYKGPGDKTQGLKDNLEYAKFDAVKGQWVVLVPGYENDAVPATSASGH